jgi:predicted nucleotidyltransferase
MKSNIREPYATYQVQIESILKRVLAGKTYAVYLFGSRAAGTTNIASDIDIAIAARDPIEAELSIARDLLSQSTIPFEVDLVDLTQTSAAFKSQVLQEGILLWTN